MSENPEEIRATENIGKGSEQKVPKAVTDANTAAERLEIANKKTEELIQRQEELAAHNELAGNTEGGQETPKEEESLADYASKAMEGKV